MRVQGSGWVRWWLVLVLVSALGGCPGDRQERAPEAQVADGSQEAAARLDPAREIAEVEALLAAGEGEGALVKARELARAAPRDGGAFLALASAALATGRLDEALDAARAGLRLSPERAGGYVLRGMIHLRRGDPSEAERSFGEALERRPTPAEARAARLQLAGLAADREAYKGEEAILRAGLEADPDDWELRAALALSLASQKDALGARAEAREAVRLNPHADKMHALLAALAWDEGDYAGAIERSAIVLRIREDDPIARQILEGAFYILTRVRLRCAHGPGEPPPEAVIATLKALEAEFDFEGVSAFVALDARFSEHEAIQAKIAEIRCEDIPARR